MGLNLTYVTRGGLVAASAYSHIDPQVSVTKTTVAFLLLAYVNKDVSDARGAPLEDPLHFEAPYDMANPLNPFEQAYSYLKAYDPSLAVQAGIDAAQAEIDAINASVPEGEQPDADTQAQLQTLADRKASYEAQLADAMGARDRWAAATDA